MRSLKKLLLLQIFKEVSSFSCSCFSTCLQYLNKENNFSVLQTFIINSYLKLCYVRFV